MRDPVDARRPDASTAGHRRRGGVPDWLAFAGVAALALLVRGLYLADLADTDLWRVLLGDGQGYDAWARQLAAGDWIGDTVFYQAPGYPYFLGVIYAIFGPSLTAVRVVQAGLGALGCVLIARAGRDFFGRRAGLAAGGLLAVYAPAVHVDALVQKTSLVLFCMAVLLWCLGRVVATGGQPMRRRWPWLVGAGVALGALGLVRENALVLAAVVVPWLAVAEARRGRRVSRAGPDAAGGRWARRFRPLLPAVLVVAGLAGALAPVAGRNLAVGGELHLTTSQLGPNFYIGNHPGASGTYEPLRPGRGHPFHERRDATELAEQALGRSLTPAEVSDYWLQRSLDYIRTQPLDWARLLGRKALLLINAVEVGDSEDLYTYQDHAWVLRLPGTVWYFGTLLPVAVLGMLLAWRRGGSVLLAMLLVYGASVVAFYVFGRYRMPLVPLLMPWAGAAVAQLAGSLRDPGLREALSAARLATTAVVVIAAIGLAHVPLTPIAPMKAVTATNVGLGVADQLDQPERAIAWYDRAIALAPDYARAHNSRGIALARLDRLEEAVASYRQAIHFDPDFADAHYNLGLALTRLARLDEAVQAYQHALRLQPDHLDARVNLGVTLARLNNLDAAAQQYRHVLRLDPANPQAHNNLGVVHARRGDLALAAMHFADAVASDPHYHDARLNLARALTRLGQLDAARPHWQHLLQHAPQSAAAAQARRELGLGGEEN